MAQAEREHARQMASSLWCMHLDCLFKGTPYNDQQALTRHCADSHKLKRPRKPRNRRRWEACDSGVPICGEWKRTGRCRKQHECQLQHPREVTYDPVELPSWFHRCRS